jgi:hypothetical protein
MLRDMAVEEFTKTTRSVYILRSSFRWPIELKHLFGPDACEEHSLSLNTGNKTWLMLR